MRIMRDMCQRIPTFTPLSQWVRIELKALKHLATTHALSILGDGAFDGKDYLVSWHAVESWGLLASRYGSAFKWNLGSRTRIDGSM